MTGEQIKAKTAEKIEHESSNPVTQVTKNHAKAQMVGEFDALPITVGSWISK